MDAFTDNLPMVYSPFNAGPFSRDQDIKFVLVSVQTSDRFMTGAQVLTAGINHIFELPIKLIHLKLIRTLHILYLIERILNKAHMQNSVKYRPY